LSRNPADTSLASITNLTINLVVIGAGPAGMRAAEVVAQAGAQVAIFDAQPSMGRKFLIAGRGGLNLTHSEPVENFPVRYREEKARWSDLLTEFGPAHLREWAAELGENTYVGSSGRVFPRGQKAAGLLRAWQARLQQLQVPFLPGERWLGLTSQGLGWQVHFRKGEEKHELFAPAVVLALGGASWPETGSNGAWTTILAGVGIELAPLLPANCGWEVDWPRDFLQTAEGSPLKNLLVRAGNEEVSGELLITSYGLEGGAVYRLGPVLRAMAAPALALDFKPQLDPETLRMRAQNFSRRDEWYCAWKLSRAAIALLKHFPSSGATDVHSEVARVKNFSIRLKRPRPIAEAISTAGGVCWRELDENLMLRKLPGVFVAGEMIDWEAPTGGYLLQGCFSTGTRAGRAAAHYSATDKSIPPSPS
jgi:uncharacterized flavoprotein (TIGR03862 family)